MRLDDRHRIRAALAAVTAIFPPQIAHAASPLDGAALSWASALPFAGILLASRVGTTGAAMIVVRPLIRANERRPHQAHVLVFAILLIANIGGVLTPLGNPPAFVGFLHGVDFFWTMQHLLPATCLVAGV